MRNKYNSNDSLFSIQYKIPYEKSSIEEHLQQSQEQINFIKIKLTEAYEKLENEIKNSTELEEQCEFMTRKAKQIEEKYHYEKKENIKLKETLQVILKNRKIMQEEVEQIKEGYNKKVNEKDKMIQELQKEMKNLNTRYASLVSQLQDKSRLVREYSDRLRDESLFKEQDNQRETALTNKIQIMEQEIARITEEKYVEVNRLRHELQLYQRSTTPAKQFKVQERRQENRAERKREFSRAPVPKKVTPKFDTRASQESQLDFNKENVHSLQLNMNMPNSSFAESSISKWKRPQSVKDSQQQEVNMSAPINTVSDDQLLTQYQISRKRAEQELCALQKIKRPSNDQRDKISRLQREIYHLDSDIAGLKRKIRRKY